MCIRDRLYDAYVADKNGNQFDKNIEVKITDFFKDGNKTSDASARAVMKPVEGKVARNVSVPSTLEMVVGDTYDLGAKLKNVPSSANILDKSEVTYDEDYINDAANYSDSVSYTHLLVVILQNWRKEWIRLSIVLK